MDFKTNWIERGTYIYIHKIQHNNMRKRCRSYTRKERGEVMRMNFKSYDYVIKKCIYEMMQQKKMTLDNKKKCLYIIRRRSEDSRKTLEKSKMKERGRNDEREYDTKEYY